MSKFISNGPCPKCGSKDNLATYDDGSAWCWSGSKGKPCHYIPPKISGFVAKKQQQEEHDGEEEHIVLPSDCTRDFPEAVVNFIKPYGLTIEELIRNAYLWSPNKGALFRHDSKHGTSRRCGWSEQRNLPTSLLGYSRKFSNRRPKSIFRGSKEDALPLTYPKDSVHQSVVCLTEDSLSALKVGRVVPAMPLFGTSISVTKIVKLIQLTKLQKIIVWLDHDKFREGWEIADKFKWLGCGAKVVLTKHDPKLYSEQEILEYIK